MVYEYIVKIASVLFASALVADVQAAPTFMKRATPCNGRTELCDRSYGSVTYAGAHNSFSVSKSILNFSANQNVGVVQQLDLGVRLLQGAGHGQNGQIRLCHTDCLLMDGGLLVDYLKKVKSWLDAHPYEVITILFTNPDALDVADWWKPAFVNAGLESLIYTPPSAETDRANWPTLGSMINSGKRVVVFMDYHMDTGKVPWILSEFDNIWETPFSVTDANFPCKIDRNNGDSNNNLYMINHSLNYKLLGIGAVIVPDRFKASKTNSVSSIISHVDGCKPLAQGRHPTFVLLDWVDKGEIFKAVNQLNGF